MNPIISNELNLFAQELQYFLSPVVLQDIAKQVGFVQRTNLLPFAYGSVKKSLAHHLYNCAVS
ncbi:hypothetical protein QF028_002675 [Neobacillus sp. B4I6]